MVYASDQAHSSIPKAALLAGFGAEHLRLIETDDEHALRLDLLERAVEDDLAAGRRPCAVVAAVGTTATTALDPVAGIAALCERHGTVAPRRRGARRHGHDLPGVPLDVGRAWSAPTPSSSTPTSGWAPASTSPPTTSATPSTWCA